MCSAASCPPSTVSARTISASKVKLPAVAIAALACAVPAAVSAQANARGNQTQMWFEELEPQHLDAGRCGLFLWARGETPSFVFVAYDVPNAAYMRANGRERALPRTQFDGERIHGQFERQTFTDGRLTVSVELVFDEKRRLQDGVVVDRGTLRAKDHQGWETVMPVGGMVACRA